MNKKLLCLTFLAAISLAAVFSAAAEDAGPLSLFEIRLLRIKGKSHAEIVDLAKQRGLAFQVDNAGQRKLRSYGFSRRQVDQLTEFHQPAAADAPPPAAKNDPPPPAGPEPQPAAGGVAQAAAKLDPATDAQFGRLADQVLRMIEKSETGAERHPAKHVTLVSNKRVADQFLPIVVKLEGLLSADYPEPIASGVDLRAANIALFETRYEYEKWAHALFRVFEEDGIRFSSNDAEQRSVAANSFFVRGIYSVCLEKMTKEESGRRVAFAVGFQYMRQLSRYKAPDALATGFGNVTEVMIYKTPSMMVKSGYADRQLGGLLSQWVQIVRERFATGQLGSVQNVLAYSTASMEPPEYAEAWSLTTLLTTNPDKIVTLIVALRTAAGAWDEISRIYEVDEKAFLAKWRRFAQAQR